MDDDFGAVWFDVAVAGRARTGGGGPARPAARRRNHADPAARRATRALARANPGALFMHCMPAHRGWEVTPEVIDGPQSVVSDIAENRLHVQKAILALLIR